MIYHCLWCLITTLSFCVCSFFSGAASSSCTSMYEKTFPIKVVQSPTHSTSSGRIHRARPRCTAQEVRHQDTEALWFLLNQLLHFLVDSMVLLFVCPVCSWRGEGGLQAASDHGFWRSVVFPSQRQLTRHREVTQRFVCIRTTIFNLLMKCVKGHWVGGHRRKITVRIQSQASGGLQKHVSLTGVLYTKLQFCVNCSLCIALNDRLNKFLLA